MNTILRIRNILCQPKCDASMIGKWCLDHYYLPGTQSKKQFWLQEIYSTLEQTEKGWGKMPLLSFPCYRFKPEKVRGLGARNATVLGTELWHHKEVCPASRKTHYSLLKTEDEAFGSKSPWESIMQPGGDPCLTHPSPACRVVLSSQLNMILSLNPICCYFSWLS